MNSIDIEKVTSRIRSNKTVKLTESGKGRLNEQVYFLLDTKNYSLIMSIYPGKKPYYRPFAELFAISKTSFYGSELEEFLIALFSHELGPGGKLFIAYEDDLETSKKLSQGVPVPLTRLGHIMWDHGFRWFKDWYFAEGFMEGDQKLQGELPLDKGHEIKQIHKMNQEIKNHLKNQNSPEKDNNR